MTYYGAKLMNSQESVAGQINRLIVLTQGLAATQEQKFDAMKRDIDGLSGSVDRDSQATHRRIGQLEERVTTLQQRSERDIDGLGKKLEEVREKTAKNTIKLWAIGSAMTALGALIGGGAVTLKYDAKGNAQLERVAPYGERASAILDAAANCRSDADTTTDRVTGQRRAKVLCLNRYLDQPVSLSAYRRAIEWSTE